MQKCNLRIVRRRATVVIRLLLLRDWIRVNPPLRKEFVAIFTPEFGAAVYGVGAYENARVSGDMGACYNGVTDGLAECGRYGREETEDFLADAVKQGEVFQIIPGDGVIPRGDRRADFDAEAFLDLRV